MRILYVTSKGHALVNMIFTLALGSTLALSACGSPTANPGSGTMPGSAASTPSASVPGADVTVLMVDDPKTVGAFQPPKITVKVGQTVGWINVSTQPHNVIFQDKTVGASDLLQKGQTFKVTFQKPGTYKYTCTLHPGMDGEIDVV